MTSFELDQVKIDSILREFDMHNISLMQRGILAEVASLLSESIGMPSNSIVGFFYIIISSWQQNKGEQFKILEDYSPEERKNVVKTMIVELKKIFKGVLIRPNQWQQLEKGIEDAFAYYQETWMNR